MIPKNNTQDTQYAQIVPESTLLQMKNNNNIYES